MTKQPPRENSNTSVDAEGSVEPTLDSETSAATLQPWELVAAGRYMPRRIRGSLRGRELG